MLFRAAERLLLRKAVTHHAQAGVGSGAISGAGVLLAAARVRAGAAARVRGLRGTTTAMEIPPRRECAERDPTPAGVGSVVRFSGLL